MANPSRPIPPSSPPMRRPYSAFPTPVISSEILTEFVSTETGDYTPLAYGTRYNEVSHIAFSKGKENFYLVYQAPADNSGWLVQRIWANDRTAQESYNYAISYLSEDPSFPQITRTFVYRRDQYGLDKDPSVGPLEPLTPDIDYPEALLVQEQMAPDAGEQLNSLYVRVTRVYQTLPGPVTPSQDFDSELNTMVFTERQLVLSDDVFQPEYEPLLLELRETPSSKYVKLRIKSFLQALPPSKTETQTGKYPFPALLFDITKTQGTIAPSPDPFSTTTPPDALSREEVIWFPNLRPAPNVPAIYSVLTTFHIGEPSRDAIYVLLTRDCSYRGISFQISISNVLCDSITVAASFSNDGRYGNLSESVTFDATTPSAAGYNNSVIGTYKVARCDIQRWRGNIWVKQTSSVLMV